jgi:hypothetical protein
MAKKKEHTVNEIYDTLTDLVGFVKNQFDKNERVTKLMSTQLLSIGSEVKNSSELIEKVDTRLRHVEQDVLTIREDVETLGKLVGRDSSTIKSHGRRIINLERSRI